MCRVVVVVALLGLLALAGARQASNGPDSDVELESRKYSKTHKKTGADKHTKNKYSDNHKPDTKHQVPKYPSPPAYAPDHPPPGSDKAYPAPGDSYKWWREHDADNQHKYKKGGGDKEYKEPWGEYAPPRDGYGPRDDYGYSGLNDEGYYSRSKGCSGLPPACDRFAVYTANEAGQGDYPPGFGPSEKTRKCASTGAAYAWPASCKGYNSIGSTCTGAAFCQEAGVPGSATATCTRSGWTVSNKCGVCEGAPPAWPRNTWPSTCQDIAVGSTCNGDCESSFEGTPVASCPSKRQGWVVTGECQLARCIGPLPDVANATWATYCPGQTVGAVCEATCDSPSEEVGTINATCTPDAEWVAGGDGFCGTRLSQVSLIFFADSINNCTQEAVDAIKNSVNQELEDSNVQVIIVEVLCFNPDGDVGAISNRTMSVAKQEATNRLRFDVFAQYIGGTEAGEQLVQTAITSPNEIGDLVDNLEAAGATLDPDATSGSVTGGDIIDPVQQEPRLTLTRIGSGPLQTNTQFSLTASYTVGGVPQAGVQITGLTIDPATSVTCTPIGSNTTSAAGTVSWQCVTGNTPGSVNITVAAVDTVSAPLSLTIGTDCVGAFGEFGACSSVCADDPGEKVQFFNVTTPAADGGRQCQFADGANNTELCTGELCCKGSPGLEGANVLYTQDFSTDAGGWFSSGTSGVMVQDSGFTPPFGSEHGVGQVDMPQVCPCPAGSCSQNPNCVGPFTRFGQSPSPTNDTKTPFWTNLTTGAPNGFVTQMAMYLDTSAGNQLLQDTRVDYSVALDDSTGGFAQDFVFNLGFYNETTPEPGSGQRRFIVSGSNNAFRSSTNPFNPDKSPIAITQSGWYIFQHLFFPEGNNLFANLTIYDGETCGEAVGTWSLGPAGFPPRTLEQLGYVRYGWIVVNEYPAATNLTVAGQVLATLGA